MMEFLKSWLLGVTAAALAVSLAQALTPEGTVKKVGKLVCGLVLLLAVVRPVAAVDPAALISDWAGPGGLSQTGAGESGKEALKILIAQKTGAYIVDKGQSLGCQVTEAAVTAAVDASGWPVPHSVRITGRWTEEGRQALSRAVEEDLAIPGERQSYQEEGS